MTFNKDKGLIEVEKSQENQLLPFDDENPIIEETKEILADKYGEV